MKARRRVARVVMACVLIALTGCADREEGWNESLPPDMRVAILEQEIAQEDAVARKGGSILRDAFPTARQIHAEQLVTAGPALRQDGVVLVVPNIRALSPALWRTLTNHVSRGGRTLFWGLDPTKQSGDTAWPMLTPASEFYTTSAQVLEGVDGDLLSTRQTISLQGPFPRPRHRHERNGGAQRWIPLATARSAGEQLRGWPASLLIEASSNAPLRAWGWIGWDPDERFERVQKALLQQAASKLYRRQFLLSAGMDRFELAADEVIEFAATIAVSPPSAGPWRLVAELENEEGAVTRRLTETIAPATPISITSTSLSLGTVSQRPERQERPTLHIALVNATDGKTIDEIRQPLVLRLDAQPDRVGDDEQLGVRGPFFVIGRRNILMNGARYTALSSDPPSNSMNPDRFDLATFHQTLDLFRETGFNSIALRYTSPAQAPQLRLILDELRPMQAWTLLGIPAFSPWLPDWSAAKAQLDALRLTSGRHIFALAPGLLAPPSAGAEQERVDAAWWQWLTEQYGSVARAEQRLGIEGLALSPGSHWNADTNTPAAYRIAVRRFLEDFVGRHYADCRAFLNQYGWTGLFTAPSGTTLDPAAGAHQLDFLTLDGAALDEGNQARAELYAPYARAVSGNKPVVWANISAETTYPPTEKSLRQQADMIDGTLRAIMRSHASGIIAGGLIGGPSGTNAVDRGLANPDGTWRPAGETLRAQLQRWRHDPAAPPPWRGREVETVNVPDGLPGLWAQTRNSAEDALFTGSAEEVRPIGMDTRSTETSPVTLTGGEAEAPEPLRSFNAQWIPQPSFAPNRQRRGTTGQAIQLNIINTGLARWTPAALERAGGVWISATLAGRKPTLIPVRETASGAQTTIYWTPTDPGAWTLRALVQPHQPFGEILRVDVE